MCWYDVLTSMRPERQLTFITYRPTSTFSTGPSNWGSQKWRTPNSKEMQANMDHVTRRALGYVAAQVRVISDVRGNPPLILTTRL